MPRRAGEPHRDRIWAWTRRWWSDAFRGAYTPTEGHHTDGPFNRSAALNTAAAAAGDWDVAMVADADCLAAPAAINHAIRCAADTGSMVTAYDRFAHLTQPMTANILNGFAGCWEPGIDWTLTYACSSMVAVPRRLWDTVGGFDERFNGWGMEDIAFLHSAVTFGGPLTRVAGTVWHLWHPPAVNTPERSTANETLMRRYADAAGNRDAMATLILERTGVPA